MIGLRFTAILFVAATCVVRAAAFSEKAVTCGTSRNVQRLSCDIGVIRVRRALYGRANKQTCSEGVSASKRMNTRCSKAGTTKFMRNRCNGKKVCEVNLLALRNPDPCSSTNKYLQTNYNCFPAIHMNVCEGSMAHLSCARGQVILVYGADYGRRDSDICSFGRPDKQLENTECSRPTNKVARKCNKRNKCTFQVTNTLFGDPCQGTYKYLEVAYTCIYTSRKPRKNKKRY